MTSFRVVVHCTVFAVFANVYRHRKKQYIGKSAWRSVRQLKKLQARPLRPATVIYRIREQCRNSCMYATMHVKKLKRGRAIRHKRLFDALQPAVGYSETLVESHVLSRILYISFVRFFSNLFFFLISFFFFLFSLHATYPRFIYSHLLASRIVTRPRER